MPDTNTLLNEDLSDPKLTAMPLLRAGGPWDFKIVKSEIALNEETGRESLRLTLNSVTPLPSKDGPDLPSTFPHLVSTNITPTEKQDAAAIRKNLAAICQSAGVKNVGDGGANLLNKVAKCKVTVQPEKDGWPERNNFRFIPAEQ